MAKKAERYKVKRIDSKGKWLPDDSTEGEKYVIALIRADLNGSQSKNRNAKKIVLKREDGTRKPLVEFKYYYYPDENGVMKKNSARSEAGFKQEINNAIDKLEEELGMTTEQQAVKEAVAKGQAASLISNVFENYIKHLKSTASDKTMEKREDSTIQDIRRAFNYFTEIFGDFPVDKFPVGVKEDFMGKMLLKTYNRGKTEKQFSAISVRKHGIALNSFFSYISERGLSIGPLIRLRLPSKKEKPPVKIWKPASLKIMTKHLERLVAESSLEPRRPDQAKISKGRIYRNHLRAWMLFKNGGMRLSEIWSLRIEKIDIINGQIFVDPVDMDGGVNARGKKFRVKFKPKKRNNNSGRVVQLDTSTLKFLRDDDKLRNDEERWFLDDGRGSNMYAAANQLGKAIDRHLDAVGIRGEAKRTHGCRASLATDLCAINPYLAQQQLGHSDIATTIEAYAGETVEELKEALEKVRNSEDSINASFGKKVQNLR